MNKYITEAAGAPKAVGPYSQAVVSGELMFLSGQIPLDAETGELVPGGVEEQTQKIMENLSAVLADQNLDFSNVVKTTIYLTDMNDFAKVNSVYERILSGQKPARVTIGVASLPLSAQVEIEMTARITG